MEYFNQKQQDWRIAQCCQWHDPKLAKRYNFGTTTKTYALKEGGKVLERLKGIDDDLMKIKFEIVEGDVPVADCNMYITVAKGGNDNESEVQWTARFYRVYKLNPPIPEGQDDESALNAMNAVVDAALPELKKFIESK